MIKGQFEITKLVHSNPQYNIYGAIPIGESCGQVQLNKYGNITIKTNGIELVERHTYNLTLKEEQSKWGMNYIVISTGLEFASTDDITPDLNYQLLCEIMTTNQAKSVHDSYPNFVQLILSNQDDEIDIKQIHGVGDVLFDKYKRKIKAKCTSFILRGACSDLDIDEYDAQILLGLYDDVEQIVEALHTDPYTPLIKNCGHSFYNLDKKIGMKYRHCDCRIEWMMDAFIKGHEYEGSTYVDAVELAREIANYDAEIVEQLKRSAIKSDIIRYDEGLNILQRTPTYYHEKQIAEFIQTSQEHNKKLDWEWQNFTEIKDGTLTEEQQSALKMVCENNFSILNGFAGSGKSSSVKAILSMIEYYGQDYVMLSPTGKAAMRLKEQTGRNAYTIHKVAMSGEPVNNDWVICDECSMLSIDLMRMIMDITDPKRTRFLFIGDSAQIPSIGLGKVFKDMIESNTIPCTTLTKCFRFDEGGASYVSTLTRQGKEYFNNPPIEYTTMGTKEDYVYIPWNNDIDLIIDTYMNEINNGAVPQDICLLVPYNKGSYGTVALNNIIQGYINPIDEKDAKIATKVENQPVIFHKGDMVMVTKNDYKAPTWKSLDDIMFDGDADFIDIDDIATTSIFNGQIGTITHIEKYNKIFDSPIAVIDIEGESVVFSNDNINTLRLAYACTIHKYQGSQSKIVINTIIPQHSYMWNRQLLYTAQTRMQKKLIEIGDWETINKAIKDIGDENRNTRLKEMLISETIGHSAMGALKVKPQFPKLFED